jgi:Flp pilus assembly pilin Flp
LLKVAVVLLLLAVVAILVYRYMDAIRAALPDRLTGATGEPDAAGASFDDDVSPARRRAKVGRDRSASTDRADETASASTDRGDTPGASEKRDTSEDETDGGLRAPGEDVDVGALVGLGALALVAALVRKFGENRPRDPLVDGPEE